jgi:hypothetical protein
MQLAKLNAIFVVYTTQMSTLVEKVIEGIPLQYQDLRL